MTEDEYLRDLQLIQEDVLLAIECFHTYLEIHHTAAEQTAVHEALNSAPEFWNIQLYSLQSTFFIILFRIFDSGPDTHSVHKVVSATIANPTFFSKAALLARKRKDEGNRSNRIDWVEYMKDVWEPTTSDLRTLKQTLKPHATKFKNLYQPIRRDVFAHRIVKDHEKISQLIGKAIIGEVDAVLYFLFFLTEFLFGLFYNGRKIAFDGPRVSYANRKERIAKTTRRVVANLANGQAAAQ